jgi:sterol 3beta-glucosyltransferase
MKALLLTVGSRGDVQPFVALAVRLRASGHAAVLAAPAVFSGLAEAYDVPFVPLELDMGQVGEAVAGRYGLRHVMRFCQAMGQRAAAVLPALGNAADGGADLVVHHPVLPLGQHVAELLGVPAVVGQAMPALVPTREFPSTVWPCRVPGMLNRPSYRAAGRLAGAWCRKDVDRWRRDVLGLPSRRGRHDPLVSGDGAPVTVLHAFSEHVIPRPADWPATAHVTGYWLLPAAQDWSPPGRLATFLEAGRKVGRSVVYVGFGSMPSLDAARLAASIMTAAGDNDVRVVVASLDPALRRLLPSGRFLVIRNAPHDWLFPQLDAIVHHGGAGTTAAALYAGKPQVIWPFCVDQPFWARRMQHLGVAPPPQPVHELTGPALAAALGRALGDPGLARRSATLAALLRAEDGAGQAVSHLEDVMAGSRVAVGA